MVQVCYLPVAGLPSHVAALDLSLGIMDSGGTHQDRAGPISFLSRIMNIASVSSHEVVMGHSPLSLSPELSSPAQPLTGAGVHFQITHMAHGGRGRRELPFCTVSSPGATFTAEVPTWCCGPASVVSSERLSRRADQNTCPAFSPGQAQKAFVPSHSMGTSL